jgi:hypothetical protein
VKWGSLEAACCFPVHRYGEKTTPFLRENFSMLPVEGVILSASPKLDKSLKSSTLCGANHESAAGGLDHILCNDTQFVDRVAYLRPADIVSRPLPCRLNDTNQPVIRTPTVFSTSRPPLMAAFEHTEPFTITIIN